MVEMFLRKIPEDMRPWECNVNGVKYVYPAGTKQNVPAEVAALIDAYWEKQAVDYPETGISFNDLRDRPFGERTEVLFDQRVELVSEEHMIEGELPISDGDMVKVTWNGVEYECTAATLPNGITYFGNPGFLGGQANDIPYVVVTGTLIGEGMFVIIAPDFIGQTVSVKVEGLVVKTIDPKFIPAGVGGGVVIVQDSAMASGVMPAVQAAPTATMNAAQIAEAVLSGKNVYFIEPNTQTLLPFVYGYRFGEMASGVMAASTAPDPFALFGSVDEEGWYVGVKVVLNGSYYTFDYGIKI